MYGRRCSSPTCSTSSACERRRCSSPCGSSASRCTSPCERKPCPSPMCPTPKCPSPCPPRCPSPSCPTPRCPSPCPSTCPPRCPSPPSCPSPRCPSPCPPRCPSPSCPTPKCPSPCPPRCPSPACPSPCPQRCPSPACPPQCPQRCPSPCPSQNCPPKCPSPGPSCPPRCPSPPSCLRRCPSPCSSPCCAKPKRVSIRRTVSVYDDDCPESPRQARRSARSPDPMDLATAEIAKCIMRSLSPCSSPCRPKPCCTKPNCCPKPSCCPKPDCCPKTNCCPKPDCCPKPSCCPKPDCCPKPACPSPCASSSGSRARSLSPCCNRGPSRSCSPCGPPPPCGPCPTVDDGCALAAELLHYIKKAFLAQLPRSSRCRYEGATWSNILCSNSFQQYLEQQQACRFTELIRKVSCIPAPCKGERHSLEDLLCTIKSVESQGLIRKLECSGYTEVACFLRDRCVFFTSLARTRVLKLATKFLNYLRKSMRMSPFDTWTCAAEDECLRSCFNQIKDCAGSCDNLKTFAWKTDKLEVCAREAHPQCGKNKGCPDARRISHKIKKLLDSPLGRELSSFCVVSYLDTAVKLLEHYCSIFQVLRDYGMC